MRTILQNGTIIDGSGRAAFPGTVVVEDGFITDVIAGGTFAAAEGRAIDCGGLAIAPGFIDAHSHNDWYAARRDPAPFFTPFLEQGITTQVAGNCGFSPFGYKAGTPHMALLGSGIFTMGDAEGDFSTFKGWRQEAGKRTPVNLAPLQGHCVIRTSLCGYENRPLMADEAAFMAQKIEESFDQGVHGLSYGLMYESDRYATPEELLRGAQITAKRGGMLTVHGRALSKASTSYSPPFGGRPHNLRALDEMMDIARKTGVRLQYSHLIYVGRSTWETVEESLALIDKARAEGVDVAYDLYAMTFGVSVITVVLPSWYLSLPAEKRKSPTARLRLAAEIAVTKRLLGFGFEDMLIAWLGEGGEELCGKRVSDIAREWKVSELDAYLKLVEMSRGEGRVNLYRYYNEDIIARLLEHEPSLLMTDAWIEEKGVQNAAAYGCFPRFLQLAREGKGLPLEQTVRKMTGATADRFHLPKRGYIRAGYAADVTVFDPAKVAAKGDSPERPTGIRHVFVNGKHAVKDGVADAVAMRGAGEILVKG